MTILNNECIKEFEGKQERFSLKHIRMTTLRVSLRHSTGYSFVVIRLHAFPSRFTPRHVPLPGNPGQRNGNYLVAACGPNALMQESFLCSAADSRYFYRKSFRNGIG